MLKQPVDEILERANGVLIAAAGGATTSWELFRC
jgi:hypothetical protein